MHRAAASATLFAIAIAIATLACSFDAARAHDSLNKEIAALSRAIVASPLDAELYLRRGELHRLATDWAAAESDYARAQRLDSGRAQIHLCRAALALDRGDPQWAVRHADSFLEVHPAHAEALLLRSRALHASGRLLEAVADLDRAIALLPSPRPEQFVDRARWLAAARPPLHEDAIRGLDAGMARLGPIVSLELAAIDLERALGRRDAALARLAKVEAQAGAQPDLRAAIEALPGGTSAPLAAVATSPPRTEVVGIGVKGTIAVPQSDASRPAPLLAATLTRGPYLQLATPSSVVVRWRTALPSDGRVRWGSSPGNLSSQVTDPALVTEHEMTITGLVPNTRIYYSVGTATETLAGGDANHFVLLPPLPGTREPVRIWILGDSGEIGATQIAVRDAYTSWTGARGTDVWLMLGDNAYDSGTDTEYQVALFSPYQTILRQCVLWPARGNHDRVFAGANNDYYDLFTMPAAAQAGGVASGSEAYYSFDHANVHFVCLDSEGSTRTKTGPMAVWLRADLAANDQDWTIAYWHHPPYTKGSHDSDDNGDSGGRMRDMRANIVPILDSLGVDLALTGHSHSYERSYLLQGHYGPSLTLLPAMILDHDSGNPGIDGAYVKQTFGPGFQEGIVHAVAGSGSHTSGGTLNHPVMYISENIPGSLVVDVDGGTLRGRFLDDFGAERDDFAIVKTGATDSGDVVRVQLQLDAAEPNPFGTATRFAYVLPAAGSVRLTVHDAAGRRIAAIESGERTAGRHVVTWDGRDGRGERVPSGVYFARLEFAGESRQGKVVLSR